MSFREFKNRIIGRMSSQKQIKALKGSLQKITNPRLLLFQKLQLKRKQTKSLIFELKESANSFVKRRNFEETNFHEEISSFLDHIKTKYYMKPQLAAAS